MNWNKIISDLLEVYTAAYVAEYVNAHASFISRLKTGAVKEPRYSVGAHLVVLWLTLKKGDYSDIELKDEAVLNPWWYRPQ